jgi:hypothetical protein
VNSDSNAPWQDRIVEQWRCARSTVELQQAAERLQRRKVVGAVLESSGGLEIAVGTALLAGGVMAFASTPNARQRQLIDMRTMERNRLHRTTAPPLRRSIERMLRWLEKDCARCRAWGPRRRVC